MQRRGLAFALALAAACGHAPAARQVTVPPVPHAHAEREILRRGTLLVARLDEDVGTDVSRPGQTFTAHVVSRIVDERGRLVLPEGARVIGHVARLEKGIGDEPARLVLAVDALGTAHGVRQIAARVTWSEGLRAEREAPGEPMRSATIGGVYFGALLLRTPGLLLGGTLGIGGGAARHAASQVSDARLPKESRIVIELDAPLYAADLAP